MVKIVDVAAYVIEKYEELTGERLDEMKLHKLLYFTQRESFAVAGRPAFDGVFEGWKFGPVSRDVRNAYCEGEIMYETNEIPDDVKYIVNNVILEYGAFESWKLSSLSHREISWVNARRGLGEKENGNRPLLLDDIREDAKKVRPYDHVWDMYYDEFDDFQEGADKG
ncbi:DUF4065 domain-containing protein [Pseudoflavonifractor sp. 524-17]|uniref:Panacea domain-containing protein n=1 Tax=Pseudoflavonifractor sp. 524-17 TaxID=2304577 RepID=UPI001379C4C4|nr:type II toxin-antitoxin system antitoxin SocA domain-containing protein [Pseudoflavonifractor sp. 524-17]NCE63751.1 DUF4065 domain-containing protein [Pseudoflavonifractor sp. 524-17]